ncbi:hypothetical protein J3S90_08800 [Flavobacterium sp. P4023]|uniref:Restriction endonuclease type IV Mrr domain-containing protein n=1 Tax=Flavobacterium flabelliforme TaxID=2816119 RepID=A0ABS5CTH4_9FLAO|nr:hypothetical protein [Flavobacterium flabelliforme]MBP4141900.1 hypothetical protein [Flavobacterium flabelliforme]
MMGNIFNKVFIVHYIDDKRKKLLAEIDKLEITESTNIAELKARLNRMYRIEPLKINEVVPTKPIETTRNRTNVWGENYKQKVFEINISIAFDGDKNLFDCYPSTSTTVYLDTNKNVTINSNNYISAKIILEDLDTSKYEAEVSNLKGELSTNIPGLNIEITPWNNSLETLINQSLEQRKGLVSKKLDFMESIGLKVNPKSDSYMIPSPIARKTIPIPVSEITKDVKREIIPILQEGVYNDIKEVLYNVGKAIERKPSIYIDKHEEDLRDIFLLFLETRYESTSGLGEAFNKKGKTDILLKYSKDNTNLFVAECKFWKGQKHFLDGITQLLGYLTHRDSKTALMIFINQKEASSIKETLKTEIKTHPNYKGFIKETYDTSLSYEFSLPEDSLKIIQIEIMLYHFPKV